MSVIDQAYSSLLDVTIGVREDIPVDDPQAMRAAYLELQVQHLQTRIALLRRVVAGLTSERDKTTNEIQRLSSLYPDVDRLTQERNYFRLVVATHKLPDDTAKEILHLRQWVQVAYLALKRAGPEYVAEFEINLPWVKNEKDEEQ